MFARPFAFSRALVAATAAWREAGAAALHVCRAAECCARPGGAPSCESVAAADMAAGAGRLSRRVPHVLGPRARTRARGPAAVWPHKRAWVAQRVSITHRPCHGFRDSASLAAARESRGLSLLLASPDDRYTRFDCSPPCSGLGLHAGTPSAQSTTDAPAPDAPLSRLLLRLWLLLLLLLLLPWRTWRARRACQFASLAP